MVVKAKKEAIWNNRIQKTNKLETIRKGRRKMKNKNMRIIILRTKRHI